MGFTHLHVHTDYSLLDSMIKIPKLVKKIKELGMEACAITDHGTAAGLVEFYSACKKEDIKPILGIEAYEAPESRFDKKSDENPNNYHHLILLVVRIRYQLVTGIFWSCIFPGPDIWTVWHTGWRMRPGEICIA